MKEVWSELMMLDRLKSPVGYYVVIHVRQNGSARMAVSGPTHPTICVETEAPPKISERRKNEWRKLALLVVDAHLERGAYWPIAYSTTAELAKRALEQATKEDPLRTTEGPRPVTSEITNFNVGTWPKTSYRKGRVVWFERGPRWRAIAIEEQDKPSSVELVVDIGTLDLRESMWAGISALDYRERAQRLADAYLEICRQGYTPIGPEETRRDLDAYAYLLMSKVLAGKPTTPKADPGAYYIRDETFSRLAGTRVDRVQQIASLLMGFQCTPEEARYLSDLALSRGRLTDAVIPGANEHLPPAYREKLEEFRERERVIGRDPLVVKFDTSRPVEWVPKLITPELENHIRAELARMAPVAERPWWWWASAIAMGSFAGALVARVLASYFHW